MRLDLSKRILKENVQTELKIDKAVGKSLEVRSLKFVLQIPNNRLKETAILRSYVAREAHCIRIIESPNNKNVMLVPQKVCNSGSHFQSNLYSFRRVSGLCPESASVRYIAGCPQGES